MNKKENFANINLKQRKDFCLYEKNINFCSYSLSFIFSCTAYERLCGGN